MVWPTRVKHDKAIEHEASAKGRNTSLDRTVTSNKRPTSSGNIVLVLVEMFKAHLVMIQRKSANPYARETEKGPRPGGAVKVPAFSSQPHLNSDC